MGFIKKLFYFILFLIIVAALVGGYLGFVPGISSIMGSDKPRDLGITTTAEDLQSAHAKLGVEYASGPFAISGSREVSASFSDRELTALINDHFSKWSAYPVSDAQVKFGEDGTAEISGILHLNRLPAYAAATGIPAEDLKKVLDKVSFITTNPPFYLKGSAQITSGQLVGGVEKLEIGRLSLPLEKFGADTSDAVDFGQDRLERAGVNVKNASIKSGAVDFSGTLPQKVTFPN